MLYTRKGDGGTSGLFGTKERFPKNSPVYEALGTLDELNSLLGVCRARTSGQANKALDVSKEVMKVQESLFIVQAELAGAEKHLLKTHVDALEHTIETIENLIENPHAFVIPGATELSALFDYVRAVCRRAERALVAASAQRPVSSPTKAYLNRLSSLLYVLARYAAIQAGTKESSPAY
ncbi:MAG: cob(I)yrinic acid a,c-diamide adenosyltransferase [Patescibacteria group bacterium]|nr:cob(I)yrinic acid a,c-diamide adenosyltransferase [Patescibacteria group bacterium]